MERLKPVDISKLDISTRCRECYPREKLHADARAIIANPKAYMNKPFPRKLVLDMSPLEATSMWCAAADLAVPGPTWLHQGLVWSMILGIILFEAGSSDTTLLPSGWEILTLKELLGATGRLNENVLSPTGDGTPAVSYTLAGIKLRFVRSNDAIFYERL